MTLTDAQADTLESLLRDAILPPLLSDLRSLSGALSMLRLYGRLSPVQRQALQEGEPLATAQLSSALQPFVRAHLYRANRFRIPMPDPDQWGDGHLSLSQLPDLRIREQRGRSVTFRLASQPAPRTATPPDAVTRFPVTRWRMAIDYGAEAPAAVILVLAAGSGPLE
jgi:hypothetical protein